MNLNPLSLFAQTASQAATRVVAEASLPWVLALVIGFPVLMVLLGEMLRWLQRRKPAYVAPLAVVRNWTLPALALLVLLSIVFGRSRNALGVRLSETMVWITLILAALALLNVVLFEGAAAGSWQAKVPRLFRDLGRFLLVLVGSAIVLSSVWGADLGAFFTALGVGSLVLGLALQDSLGNIFSGLALLFEQPIGMGDWIQIGDSIGEVVEVNWRSVHLQTENFDQLVIPNSELAKGKFSNFSRPDRLHRTQIPISFSRDDPPDRVRRILIDAALEIDGVLSQPEPDVSVVRYGDFSIHYSLDLFSRDYPSGESIRSQINRRIWYLAQRHGLTIPYPINRQQPYVPPVRSLHSRCLRLLRATPGLAGLAAERLDELAALCEVRAYAAEERVLRQGAPLDGLYLILSGEAELLLPDREGRERSLGLLLSGEWFGEKSSLLHGRVSDTVVRARQELEVIVIPVHELQTLLVEAPRLAADLAEVIEIRRLGRPVAPTLLPG